MKDSPHPLREQPCVCVWFSQKTANNNSFLLRAAFACRDIRPSSWRVTGDRLDVGWWHRSPDSHLLFCTRGPCSPGGGEEQDLQIDVQHNPPEECIQPQRTENNKDETKSYIYVRVRYYPSVHWLLCLPHCWVEEAGVSCVNISLYVELIRNECSGFSTEFTVVGGKVKRFLSSGLKLFEGLRAVLHSFQMLRKLNKK